MAITKIFPIKKTLHKAIKYIANPQKTDKSALVSTYQCGIYTADLEMEIIAKQGKGAEKKNNRGASEMARAKSTDCSSEGPEFKSQQPHGGSQP